MGVGVGQVVQLWLFLRKTITQRVFEVYGLQKMFVRYKERKCEHPFTAHT